MTAQERRAKKKIVDYEMSDKHNLWDAYGSFSEGKRDAWEYCQKLCKEKNGSGLKVIGSNTSFFTAGFVFEEDGQKKFMYITKGSDTAVDYEF